MWIKTSTEVVLLNYVIAHPNNSSYKTVSCKIRFIFLWVYLWVNIVHLEEINIFE